MALNFIIFYLPLTFSQKDLISGQLNGYYSLSQIQDYFQQIQTLHPDITQQGSLGLTFQNNPIPYLKLTSPGLPYNEKPATIFSASLFSGYLIGSQAVIHALDLILQNTSHLSSQICYFIPIINTDAWLQMQQAFNQSGEFQVRFKNLNTEGCQNSEGGVNLNRNFEFYWGKDEEGSSSYSCDIDYRGKQAVSQLETKTITELVSSLHKGLWLHFQMYGQIVEIPFASGEEESDQVLEKQGGLFQEFYKRVAKEIDFDMKNAYQRYGDKEDGTIMDYSYQLNFLPVLISLGEELNKKSDLFDIVDESSDLINFMYFQNAYSIKLRNLDIEEQGCQEDEKYTCQEGAFSYFVFQYELENESPTLSPLLNLEFDLFKPLNASEYSFQNGEIFMEFSLFNQELQGFDQSLYSIRSNFENDQQSWKLRGQYQIPGYHIACVYFVMERFNIQGASQQYSYNYTFRSYPQSLSSVDSLFVLESFQSVKIDQTVRENNQSDQSEEDDNTKVTVIVVVILFFLGGIGVAMFMCWRRAKRMKRDENSEQVDLNIEEVKIEEM